MNKDTIKQALEAAKQTLTDYPGGWANDVQKSIWDGERRKALNTIDAALEAEQAASAAQPHPLEGLHINQGSFDAASDSYEAEYWQAKFEKITAQLGGPFTDLSKDANGNYNDKFAFYAYIGWQWRGNEHAAAPVQPASQTDCLNFPLCGCKTPCDVPEEASEVATDADFNDWWDADMLTQTNPFRDDSPAYWAWEGWCAAQAAQPCRDDALDRLLQLVIDLKDSHQALAAKNNGRQSDFAFGAIGLADKVIDTIRSLRAQAQATTAEPSVPVQAVTLTDEEIEAAINGIPGLIDCLLDPYDALNNGCYYSSLYADTRRLVRRLLSGSATERKNDD